MSRALWFATFIASVLLESFVASAQSGPVAPEEGLTQQEISAVIRANLNEIRHCYEPLVERVPNKTARVDVRFVIAGNGEVQSVEIVKTENPAIDFCFTHKIARWKFPKPRGGAPVTVNYPFFVTPL